MTAAGGLVASRWGGRFPATAAGLSRLRWAIAGLAVILGGGGIVRGLPSEPRGVLRCLAVAAAGLVLGNLTGRSLGLQRRLDVWGRSLSTPRPQGSPGDPEARTALSLGLLMALNPLLIPASIQEGLEGRWHGLALKSILDGVGLSSWCRSLSAGPSPGLVLRVVGPVAAWQALWTAAAGLAGGGMARESSAPLMLASHLLILCSAPAIAGIRKTPQANLLPTLIWIPLLTAWLGH